MINFITPTIQTPWGKTTLTHTPERLTQLPTNHIFVFGSNLAGLHGAGAARDAIKWGAEMGKGIGRKGNTYAIPTKGFTMDVILEPKEVLAYVNSFKVYAAQHFREVFVMTKIGCGLANPYSDEEGGEQKRIEEIGKMMRGCPKNVILPKEWEKYR